MREIIRKTSRVRVIIQILKAILYFIYYSPSMYRLTFNYSRRPILVQEQQKCRETLLFLKHVGESQTIVDL